MMALYLHRNKESFVKQPSKILSAFFLAILLLSCAGPPQAGLSSSPRPADCWLLQPAVYRMRQSAQLEYQGKKEMLEGFMELNLNRDRAHLVIFSNLGLTLLNIEIERHHYQLIEADTKTEDGVPTNKKKQLFAASVASAVQHIFFSLENYQKDHHSKYQPPHVEFSGIPPRLTKISEDRRKSAWSVTFHDYHRGSAGWLPEQIILENQKPAYRLTLWIHKAELSTKGSKKESR